MGFYPNRINETFRSPAKAGWVEDANGEGTSVAFECGTFLRMSLRITRAGLIEDAKYKSNGCGFAIAAAEVIANLLAGKDLKDLHGLEDREVALDLIGKLDKFPPSREHCAGLGIAAAKAAFADYRIRRIVEFQGEKAIICTCFGVSEETIEKLIDRGDAMEVSDVSAITRAGTGCGSCRMLIQELLDVTGQG